MVSDEDSIHLDASKHGVDIAALTGASMLADPLPLINLWFLEIKSRWRA